MINLDSGAGIWTRDLLDMNLLSLPLHQAFRS